MICFVLSHSAACSGKYQLGLYVVYCLLLRRCCIAFSEKINTVFHMLALITMMDKREHNAK
jgi:hypothetical protein